MARTCLLVMSLVSNGARRETIRRRRGRNLAALAVLRRVPCAGAAVDL